MHNLQSSQPFCGGYINPGQLTQFALNEYINNPALKRGETILKKSINSCIRERYSYSKKECFFGCYSQKLQNTRIKKLFVFLYFLKQKMLYKKSLFL